MRSSNRDANDVLPEPVPPATPIRIDNAGLAVCRWKSEATWAEGRLSTRGAITDNQAPDMMAPLRALAYFLEEALTSLWRSRLINALSVGTIAVSLFVLGAFLTVASNLNQVVDRWTQKVRVTFFLTDGLETHIRESLVNRLREDPAVESLEVVSREQALERFRTLFRDRKSTRLNSSH